jgi:hypothetical protein
LVVPMSAPGPEVEQRLSVSRDALLGQMTDTQYKPLRDFIIHNYPTVPPSADGRVGIDTIDSLITAARAVGSLLSTAHPLRVNLAVRSQPAGAIFMISPYLGGDTVKLGTNGTLKNFCRGLYKYSVIRKGMKQIDGVLDLVRDGSPILSCTFVSDNSTADPLPCSQSTK